MKRASERGVRLPKEANGERRGSTRFPIVQEVRYTVAGNEPPSEIGFGLSIDLSGTGICFTSERPLLVGQRLDVAIDWPAVLEGGIQLQLITSGVVVRTNGMITAMRIQRYEFKTRRLGLRVVPPRESRG